VGWKEEEVTGLRVQEYKWLFVRQETTQINLNEKFSKMEKIQEFATCDKNE